MEQDDFNPNPLDHHEEGGPSRGEVRRAQAASELAELERRKKLSDVDTLNELYDEFQDDDADFSNDDDSDDHADRLSDGEEAEEGDGAAPLAYTGERMDEHRRRVAKEERTAQSQAQKEAAAAARKEARLAKAAETAKAREAAKAEAKAAKEAAAKAAAAAKDASQRTIVDSFKAKGGANGGKLDIDKRLQTLMGGAAEGEGGVGGATGVGSSASQHAQQQQQNTFAALGKSILAGLGGDSDDDDDDDAYGYGQGGGIDLNAALFADVRENTAVDTFVFGKTAAAAAASEAPQPTAAGADAAPLMDRLVDEQSFDYGEAASSSAAATKAGKGAAAAKARVSSATPAAATPASVTTANTNASNFKQREAGVVATSEHINIGGADANDNNAGGGAVDVDGDAAGEEALLNAAQMSADAKAEAAGSLKMGKDAPTVLAGDMPHCAAQLHGTFYWMDAKEIGPHSLVDAGSVYLLGKILLPGGKGAAYESCCVRVNGMYRSLLFRPMPSAPQDAAIAEVMGQLHRQGIKQFTLKVVKRYYCFDEPDVPRERREAQQWLKVTYSASSPLFSVPQTISRPPHTGPAGTSPAPVPLPGYEHIERCVGADRSLIETFLLKRRFTFGPSFVRFNERLTPVPPTARVSHCKHEFIASGPKTVFPWDRPFRSTDYGAVPASLPVYTGSPAHKHNGLFATATAATHAPHFATQQTFSPPHYPPQLSGATIQLVTQLNAAGTQNEIFAICIAMCQNSILPDGGRRAVPPTDHVLLVRPFDGRTPLPLELAGAGRAAQLRVTPLSNEKEMLQWLTDFLIAQDPDVLLGHNFASFTLDVLLHRMAALYVSNWSALGRIRQSTMPQLQKGAGGMREATYGEKEACLGRLLCDTYLLAREHHRTANYKLLALARDLGLRGIYTTGVTQEMVEEAPPTVTRELMTVARDTVHVLGRCLNLARLTFELAYRLDMIPLTKQLCAQSGTTWSRVLIGARSERIEFLLLHAFYAQKYVLPEKKRFSFNTNNAGGSAIGGGGAVKRHRDAEEAGAGGGDHDAFDGEGGGGAATSTSAKRSAKYKGGMVLEPISGLYHDYILMLDFNSLYPSLIQEFNICFTTVNRSSNPNVEVAVPLAEDLSCALCVEAGRHCPHKNILPRVIERLVTSRREVKRRMKTERSEDVLAQLDIRQTALKLTANSMYGCLGFEFSRFYAQPLAELVTSKGRDTLSNTVALIPTVAPSLRVIYGDTDSVMMQTGVRDSLATVREFGQRIQAAVNKKYKKLEIGIDGVYRSILLMTKKKYAALAVDNWEGAGDQLSEVVKGLDMVRRDWCPLVRIACKDILHRVLRGAAAPSSATAQYVVQQLAAEAAAELSGNGGAAAPQPLDDEDDVLQFILAYMQRIAEQVRAGQTYELKEFVISKSLTKEPESYKGDNFPHATVALRMKQRKEAVRVGDLIPYVICKERTRLPTAQRLPTAAKPEAADGAVKTEGGSSVKAEEGTTVKNEDDDNANTNNNNDDDVTTVMMGGSKLSHHAYHEDEVKRDPAKHHLDVEWYLSTQIYPPVLRICQHIQGFSAGQLAERMGLRNAAQIAATAEAAAEAEAGGGKAGGHGAGGNTWGTFDTQYLSRFKTDRLEECFPLADAVEIKCAACQRFSSLQPHDYIERSILPLFREKKKDNGFTGRPCGVFKAFDLYSCSNCHTSFALRYVSNTMSLFIQRKLRAFYANGGSAGEVSKIQSQMSYLRALFDVPHLPGVSPDVIALHKRFALRCVDADGALCTLEDPDGVDPVKELVERTYRRVHGLRISTEQLFN